MALLQVVSVGSLQTNKHRNGDNVYVCVRASVCVYARTLRVRLHNESYKEWYTRIRSGERVVTYLDARSRTGYVALCEGVFNTYSKPKM